MLDLDGQKGSIDMSGLAITDKERRALHRRAEFPLLAGISDHPGYAPALLN
jgi:hypothetical protein